MIKYKAYHEFIRVKIQAVEIARETASYVVYHDGTKESKKLAMTKFFDEFEDAKSWLIEECNKSLDGCRRSLQLAQSTLGNAKGLKP